MTRATPARISAARDPPRPIAAAACSRSLSARRIRTPPQIRKLPGNQPLRIECRPILRTSYLSSELRALTSRRFSFQLIEQFFAMRPQCANHIVLHRAARRRIDHYRGRRVYGDRRTTTAVIRDRDIAQRPCELARRNTRGRHHPANRWSNANLSQDSGIGKGRSSCRVTFSRAPRRLRIRSQHSRDVFSSVRGHSAHVRARQFRKLSKNPRTRIDYCRRAIPPAACPRRLDLIPRSPRTQTAPRAAPGAVANRFTIADRSRLNHSLIFQKRVARANLQTINSRPRNARSRSRDSKTLVPDVDRSVKTTQRGRDIRSAHFCRRFDCPGVLGHLMLAAVRLRSRRIAIEGAALRGRSFHSQRTTRKFLAVHRSQRDCSLVLILHLDKAKPARAPVETVAHDLGSLDGADFGERLAQIAIAQRKTQIPYK